jgi:hypothetical protein
MCIAYEDGFLEIIALLSSGVDEAVVKKRLGLSDGLFRDRLRVAYEKLKRVSGLSEEAASAIIWPRRHGVAAKLKYFPRFSTRAATVEKARELDAFHDSCQAVRDACQEMETIGLSDLASGIKGWRPADHDTTPEAKMALQAESPDIVLYVWPEGLRLDGMKGHVNFVDLQMIKKIPNEGVLSGYLLRDVQDQASAYVGCKGAIVAFHLSPADEDSWREYLLTQRIGRKAIRVRVCKSDSTNGLVFNPSEV